MRARAVLVLAAQTRDQAEAFVKQALDFSKMNPKEKFLEEVSGVIGQFHFNRGPEQRLDRLQETQPGPGQQVDEERLLGGTAQRHDHRRWDLRVRGLSALSYR
jgi:hypothetical protein